MKTTRKINRNEYKRFIRQIETISENKTESTVENLRDQKAYQNFLNQKIVNTENNEASKTSEFFILSNRDSEKGLVVDLDLLSSQLNRLRIDLSQKLDNTPTTALRQQIRVNQKHANERSKRQYGKQRQTIIYNVRDQISVAVSALDRTSTNDKRLFGKIIDVKEKYDSYRIIIKHRILNRYYSISELNPLSNYIDIEISEPLSSDIITLRYCAV